MRHVTTTLSILLFGLFTLAGCGAAGGYDGYADDYVYDEYDLIDDVLYWLYKPGVTFAEFERSDEGAAVHAGTETVAFTTGADHSLIRGGHPVPGLQMTSDGALLREGELVGFVVLVHTAEDKLGAALSTADGRALILDADGALIATDAGLHLAAGIDGGLTRARVAGTE